MRNIAFDVALPDANTAVRISTTDLAEIVWIANHEDQICDDALDLVEFQWHIKDCYSLLELSQLDKFHAFVFFLGNATTAKKQGQIPDG